MIRVERGETETGVTTEIETVIGVTAETEIEVTTEAMTKADLEDDLNIEFLEIY